MLIVLAILTMERIRVQKRAQIHSLQNYLLQIIRRNWLHVILK